MMANLFGRVSNTDTGYDLSVKISERRLDWRKYYTVHFKANGFVSMLFILTPRGLAKL